MDLMLRDAVHQEIMIREIAAEDAEAAARLCAELGYPSEPDEVSQRIAAMRSAPDSIVYVACNSGAVVGWIEVAIARHLAIAPFGEITGLVVSDNHRSRGIGRKLVAAAEDWVAARGIPTMIVRSRTSRERAHRFYLRESYSVIKTSLVFSKPLAR